MEPKANKYWPSSLNEQLFDIFSNKRRTTLSPFMKSNVAMKKDNAKDNTTKEDRVFQISNMVKNPVIYVIGDDKEKNVTLIHEILNELNPYLCVEIGNHRQTPPTYLDNILSPSFIHEDYNETEWDNIIAKYRAFCAAEKDRWNKNISIVNNRCGPDEIIDTCHREGKDLNISFINHVSSILPIHERHVSTIDYLFLNYSSGEFTRRLLCSTFFKNIYSFETFDKLLDLTKEGCRYMVLTKDKKVYRYNTSTIPSNRNQTDEVENNVTAPHQVKKQIESGDDAKQSIELFSLIAKTELKYGKEISKEKLDKIMKFVEDYMKNNE